MQMLPRSLPETIDDVIVQVALVRPGPIQGGAVHPYLERRKLLREDPDLRGSIRAPEPRADPLRHARGDRLPGPGDPGGDGARWVHGRRGGGTAPGDEPQALRGGAERLRRALRRRRHRTRGRSRACRAGLRAGARVLGVRLSEVTCGSLRAARLPVDLAARPLRARAALLAVQRAADGLLPARLARPRGAAARDRGASRRRQPAARSSARSSRGRRPSRRCGSDSATSRASASRKRACWSPSATRRCLSRPRRPRLALGRWAATALERLAWAGACGALGVAEGTAPRREELWRLGIARGGRRIARPWSCPARPAAAAPGAARPAPARLLGADRRRLRLDRGHPRRASDGGRCVPGSSKTSLAATSCDGRRSQPDRGRRPGRRPPAPGDCQGRRLHAASRTRPGSPT